MLMDFEDLLIERAVGGGPPCRRSVTSTDVRDIGAAGRKLKQLHYPERKLGVIQTCKANGVDPQAYIADVTGKIAADWPAARWDELMPWNWAQQPAKPIAQAA